MVIEEIKILAFKREQIPFAAIFLHKDIGDYIDPWFNGLTSVDFFDGDISYFNIFALHVFSH